MLLPLDVWRVLTSPWPQPPSTGTCSGARVSVRLRGISGSSLCLCEPVSSRVRWEQPYSVRVLGLLKTLSQVLCPVLWWLLKMERSQLTRASGKLTTEVHAGCHFLLPGSERPWSQKPEFLRMSALQHPSAAHFCWKTHTVLWQAVVSSHLWEQKLALENSRALHSSACKIFLND